MGNPPLERVAALQSHVAQAEVQIPRHGATALPRKGGCGAQHQPLPATRCAHLRKTLSLGFGVLSLGFGVLSQSVFSTPSQRALPHGHGGFVYLKKIN